MPFNSRRIFAACLLCLTTACADDSNTAQVEQLNSSSSETRSGALTDERARGYTLLTAKQRAKAERQPWEKPGLEDLKPPQEVLDAQFGDRNTFVPDPEGIEQLDLLEQRWDARRQYLEQAQGLNDAEIKSHYLEFHENFLREHLVSQGN